MSILTSLLGGGGANVGALQRQQSKMIDRANSLADLLVQGYQANAQAGAFDPNAQLDLLRRDSAYSAQRAAGNAAATARTLGYRPGDSSPLKAQRAVSERASIDYAALANQIRQNATERGAAALGQAAGGAASIYGQGAGLVGNQIQTAMAQQAQGQGLFGTLLGSAMPFLAPRRTSSPFQILKP